MAFVSLKVQRIIAYVLILVCVVLLYRFYHNGKIASSSGKRWIQASSEREIRAVGTRANFDYETRTRRENVSKYREQHSLLRREVKLLKIKLMKSKLLNHRLRKNVQALKKKEENLIRDITRLKTQNTDLLGEIDSLNQSKRHHENDDLATKDEESQRHSTTPSRQSKPSMKIAENIPFNSFAKTHFYEADSQPRPKEYMFRGQNRDTRIVKPIRKHIFKMEDKVIEILNANQSLRLTRENLMEGVYRLDVNAGADYEFYFRHPKSTNTVVPVRVWRELSEPRVEILSSRRKRLDETINLILPLSGRLERFQSFIELFVDVCIKKDKNIYLTVVLYGEKDFAFIKKILQGLETEHGFRKYELVMRDKEFSRGRALHDGVVYWKGSNPNVLMFFCDVDITFNLDFLRRCRTYTEPGKQVYYPIVFSLYNPKNVYVEGSIPEPEAQLIIERNHGFWRNYGFGMTCQYRTDYLGVGGFDLSIEGWGSEDQQLYSRYLQKPGFRIIRAPDRDLFHFFHEKHCDPNLKWEQYRSCLGSKAKTEGSPAQIAIQLTRLREKYEGFEKNE